MVKRLIFFLLAVFVTATLVSIVATQLVLADIQGFGIPVTLAERMSATVHDLLGLGPTLLVLFTPTMAVAFGIAYVANKRFPSSARGRSLWYCASGFTSLPAVIYLIRIAMGATLLAAARTPTGMLLLAALGLIGGWIFALLTASLAPTGGQRV